MVGKFNLYSKTWVSSFGAVKFNFIQVELALQNLVLAKFRWVSLTYMKFNLKPRFGFSKSCGHAVHRESGKKMSGPFKKECPSQG